MTYYITQPCIDVMDQSCVDVCPVDCIHFEEGDDRMLYIDPDECIDCGACEPACPVNAIYAEDDLPDAGARGRGGSVGLRRDQRALVLGRLRRAREGARLAPLPAPWARRHRTRPEGDP